MPEDKDDYVIGFGKPPKHGQFKKGQSGNPKGRPKGSKSLATIFNEQANETVWVNTPKGSKRMSKMEMGIAQLLNQSAKGHYRAIREVVGLKKSFGDETLLQAPPIIQVNFVKSRHERLKLTPIIDVEKRVDVEEDEEEWVDVEDRSEN